MKADRGAGSMAVPGAGVTSTVRHPGMALVALIVAGVAQAVDVGVHSTAIAAVAADLPVPPSQRAFATAAATLALAASILTIGNLGDRYGRRRVLLWCTGALVLGGAITASAQGVPVFVAGRMVSGIGLAGTLALSMALIRTVAPNRVGAAMSWYFMGQVAFAIPLTLLGGQLIGISWRLGYLVVPLVGSIAFVINLLFAPPSRATSRGRTDKLGLVLVAAGLTGVVWGVSQASHGWRSPDLLLPLTLGIVTLGVFIWWELHCPEPALPVRLFANRNLAAALVADVSFNMWQAVMVLQLSLLWQYSKGDTPFDVSLKQLPATLAMVAGAFVAGRLATHGMAPQRMMLFGLGGIVVSTALLATGGEATPYAVFLVGLVAGGFSRMLTETAAGQFFVSVPPADLVGATVASKPAIGQASFALGSALSSGIVYGVFGTFAAKRLAPLGLTSGQARAVSDWFLGGPLPGSGIATRDDLVALTSGAYDSAYRITMVVFVAVFILLFALAGYLVKRPARAEHRE